MTKYSTNASQENDL